MSKYLYLSIILSINGITMSRRSSVIVYSGIMGSLAAVLSFLKAEIPFPILPYLKIDFAEIPDVLSFLLFGPAVGMFTTTVHWLILNLRTEWPVIGPLMKYIAVLSMLSGFTVGSKIGTKLRSFSLNSLLLIMAIFGSIVRVLTMTIANIIVIYFIYGPYFFDYVRKLLTNVGLVLQGETAIFIAVLVLTGLYNIVNLLVGLVPSQAILNSIRQVISNTTFQEAWIYKNLKIRSE